MRQILDNADKAKALKKERKEQERLRDIQLQEAYVANEMAKEKKRADEMARVAERCSQRGQVFSDNVLAKLQAEEEFRTKQIDDYVRNRAVKERLAAEKAQAQRQAAFENLQKTIDGQLQDRRDETERRRQEDLQLKAQIAAKVIADREAQEAREKKKQSERHELA